MDTEREKKDASSEKVHDLEIKDAHLIFDGVWTELVAERGEENLLFPTEIFWVNGAPGAGKGTNNRTMMEFRDITAPPIVISDLLKSPEARKRMDAGVLVGDREVCALLFRELLKPQYAQGAVVDGFPRTQVQVETLKLFHRKLADLSTRLVGDDGLPHFRRPQFHILILFIDEEESVQRQLERGRQAIEHNREVEASGIGEQISVRKTDLEEEAARNRYKIFKEQTFEPLKSLREIFYFHFINTQCSIEEARERILRELEYQSTLELSRDTFSRLSTIPLASEIVVHARQELIQRLEDYERHYPDLFGQVVRLMAEKFMPIVQRHAISGRATINSEDAVFDNHLALAMLIDVFSERGYHASVDVRRERIPVRFDPETNQIETREQRVYRFSIWFAGSEIRRGR